MVFFIGIIFFLGVFAIHRNNDANRYKALCEKLAKRL